MNEFSKFIRKYNSDGFLRLHTPGHQARCEFINRISPYFDITEIQGADSLYSSSGIIRALEEDISQLYNSQSVISAGGSTLCVQTMVSLFKGRKFIAMRSSHISFYNICALLDIQPEWVGFNFKNSSSGMPTPSEIEKLLIKIKKPVAVYLTSPNYYGVRADIRNISKICKKYGAVLIVDNAHGAHLKFTTFDEHPISLGADICCDSFHKTLPTLTGAAVLHSKKGLFNRNEVKYAMSVFGSTSPSYMIMDSIGLCADWLKKEGKICFRKLEKNRNKLIKNIHLNFLKTDCSKITIDCCNIEGKTNELKTLLRLYKIEPEYVDSRYVTLILSPFLNFQDWVRLKACLEKVEKCYNNCYYDIDLFSAPKVKLSLNEAFWSEVEQIDVENSVGRICGKAQVVCPPGVPIVAAGELIDGNIVKLLIKNNIKFIYVVKRI